MVNEDRRLIGTQKALGMRTHEISAGYLFYGVLAVTLGVVIGVILSYFLLENIIYLYAYESAFQAKDFIPSILTPPAK